MTKHQDSELQGEEREREALNHIRKEQELRTGATFDFWLLKYLEEGDTPHFREQLRTVTKDYLFEVTRHPHVIKAAVPDWVTRLLVPGGPPKSNYDLRLFNPGLIAAGPAEIPVYSSRLDELSKALRPLSEDTKENVDPANESEDAE